jgi:hypothetical protein
MLPLDKAELGSIVKTATFFSSPHKKDPNELINVLLPAPGAPVIAIR